MDAIDAVQLNYNQDNIFLVNICLAFIMFGVALGISVQDFKRILSNPRPVLIGLLSQFVVLPVLTFFLVLVAEPKASLALGMMMVAACPGGNISNFMSSLAKGNAALSVSLTAISSILAIFLTPFNLAFWGSLYEPTAAILREVDLSVWEVFKTIVMILGVPIVAGMTFNRFLPNVAKKIRPVMMVVSILIFATIVVLAFAANIDIFLNQIHLVFLMVLLHNAIALVSGYQIGNIFGLDQSNKRALSIETGIQNSGLGLLLIFTFFDGLGGMAIVAAWWGIWHIISGLGIAGFWHRKGIYA
ncbi:MAG: bile acid:sodium symporter family protein [Cyclobacteriaceae bacterium]|nr:bile acid:sodium symporter family protein [Cyclobacteriaceae bacterium HetDA_MAG_MS6]